MNGKIIAAGVLIFFIVILSVFAVFIIKGTGYEEETSWGRWYQDYKAYYVDGGSASLSIYHNDNAVDHIEYILKTELNEDYGSAGTFNFNDYSIQVKTGASVLSRIDFSGEYTVQSDEGQCVLFTKNFDLSSLTDMENGTYHVEFVPVGSIQLDGEDTMLPSEASVLVRVGETTDDGNGGEDTKEINFKSEVIWS